MKKISVSLLIACSILVFTSISAGTINNIILCDSFSSACNWLSQGTGEVNVSGGKCNFANVYCGAYNRVYRDIGTTLSDTYWRAECDFSIVNENPEGFGTGEVVMALTAGTLDFMSYDIFQNYTETYQDGIAVIILSASSTNNNINKWYFIIEGKKDNIRTFDTSSVIYADSSITSYYIRLERTAKGSTQLSVFSDSTFTSHLTGSPVTFEVDSTITGLNTIQHGTITPGNYTRLINAELDNILICDDEVNTSISGYDNTTSNQILIYPNPSKSFINIILPDSLTLQNNSCYTICDLMGRDISSHKLDLSKKIDISFLPEGVFLILISDSKKTYWAKFTKSD